MSDIVPNKIKNKKLVATIKRLLFSCSSLLREFNSQEDTPSKSFIEHFNILIEDLTAYSEEYEDAPLRILVQNLYGLLRSYTVVVNKKNYVLPIKSMLREVSHYLSDSYEFGMTTRSSYLIGELKENVGDSIRSFNNIDPRMPNRIFLISDTYAEISSYLETLDFVVETMPYRGYNQQEVVDAIVSLKPDLILMKIENDDAVISFLRLLKLDKNTNRIPIIGLTELVNARLEVDLYEIGLDKLIGLPSEINSFLFTIKNTIQLLNAHKVESQRDSLTGLPNRKYFYEYYESAIKIYQRRPRGAKTFTLAAFDLDKFKSVNDTYGHNCGDYVLREYSAFIRSRAPKDSLFVRWGGEEFLMLLGDRTCEEAKRILDKIREEFSQKTFTWEGFEFPKTFSCGVVEYRVHGENLEELIEEADVALYYAKNTGRNRVIIKTDGMTKDAKVDMTAALYTFSVDPIHTKTLSRKLQGTQIQMYRLADFRDFVAAYKENKVDIVVLDMHNIDKEVYQKLTTIARIFLLYPNELALSRGLLKGIPADAFISIEDDLAETIRERTT